MRFEVKVKAPFADKYTGKMYEAGDTISFDDEFRLKDMVNRRLATLVHAVPKIKTKKTGKRVLVYQNFLNVIGGIETADYNLAKTFQERKIKFVFRSGDLGQMLRLAEFCEVEIDDGQKNFETDVLILANYDSYPLVKGRVKAKKIYQQVHADWTNMRKMPQWANFVWAPDDDVDRVLAVSGTVVQALRTAFNAPIESVLVPNIPRPVEDEFRTFLTLSRLTAEKGADLIVRMVDRFHQERRKFLWIISATISDSQIDKRLGDDESVVFVKPSAENSAMVKSVDYLVQLSKNESYCYSVHEALSVGTPVIGTKIPEIEKVVKDGENGYLVGQNLEGLDAEAIFTKKPVFKPLVEKIDPIWEKVLGGEL